MFSAIRNQASKARNYITAGTIMAANSAFAQAADPFTTAVADVTAKIQVYGPALVALSAVGVVFVLAIKYVKKIPSAS